MCVPGGIHAMTCAVAWRPCCWDLKISSHELLQIRSEDARRKDGASKVWAVRINRGKGPVELGLRLADLGAPPARAAGVDPQRHAPSSIAPSPHRPIAPSFPIPLPPLPDP